MDVFLTLASMFVSVLLILVILLQRGRGGGLVGALSGLGGQSAFGTKAGDTFTRITIVIAAVWVMLAGITGQVLRSSADKSANYDKVELKTDMQAPSNDGKKDAKVKDSETGADEGSSRDATKLEPESSKEKKEPVESKDDAKGEEAPKIDKGVKPETPTADPKESPKKDSEPKGGESEKKNEADSDASKSK